MPYSAVFFDLDDTLYNDSGSWRTSATATAEFAAVRVRGMMAQPLAEAFLECSDAYWQSMDPTQETRPILDIRIEHWLASFRRVGYSENRLLGRELAQEYGRQRSTGIALFPDALPLLTALRTAGKTLILITNGLQSTHIERIALLGLKEQFDHTLISDAVGFAKPDPRLFRHALALAGCASSEAAMVGDNLVNDIGGAQAIGTDTFWFNPEARALPPNAPAPRGGEVRALADLHTLL
jgi:HAD superfamily hydrolase (TIGR01549 family)